MNDPALAVSTDPGPDTALRALIVGGGIAATVAAQSLSAMGIQVTLVRFKDAVSHLFYSAPGSNSSDGREGLNLLPNTVRVVETDRAPRIHRTGGRFDAVFYDGTSSSFDSLFLAPHISLLTPDASLSHAELFREEAEIVSGQRVAFLLDYLNRSDPVLGMAAMKRACRSVETGGEALICFRHIPVQHLFGETLYNEAKKLGVRFVRFGEEPPAVQPIGADEESSSQQAAFRLAVKNVIDGEQFVYDCDRVFVVTGPDASSLPTWALEMVHNEADTEGFLLSESVHTVPGNSFSSGVFVVGEATGNLDLINNVARARSAAAVASAWMKASRLKGGERTVSIGSRCVRCLTCYRVCPHRAISMPNESPHARPEAWPSLCRECGICAGVCPSTAIDFQNGPESALTPWIRETDPAQAARTVLIFGCQRSAGRIAPAISLPDEVHFIPVPCAGSVSEYALWSALSAGVKGVLVMGCRHGNCRSDSGPGWAKARIDRALETGLFGDKTPHIGFETVSPNEPARFKRLVEKFVFDKP